MSALPYLACIALLAAILLIQQREHNRMIRGLVNKLLIQEGLEPIQDEPEPVTEATKSKLEETITSLKRAKYQAGPVHFNIPGMPTFHKK